MPSSAPWVLSQVQVVAEAAATIAFALSGVIEAARKRLDPHRLSQRPVGPR